MIDLGTLHAHQIAAALRYQRGPLEPVRYLDGDTTVTLALPRPLYRPARPSRTRRAARWTLTALGWFAAGSALASIGLGCIGITIITGLWPS